MKTKGTVVSFNPASNTYQVDNRQGRSVAIINLLVGIILGFMLLAIGYLAKEQPFIAIGVFVACLGVMWWRVRKVFRNIP